MPPIALPKVPDLSQEVSVSVHPVMSAAERMTVFLIKAELVQMGGNLIDIYPVDSVIHHQAVEQTGNSVLPELLRGTHREEAP